MGLFRKARKNERTSQGSKADFIEDAQQDSSRVPSISRPDSSRSQSVGEIIKSKLKEELIEAIKKNIENSESNTSQNIKTLDNLRDVQGEQHDGESGEERQDEERQDEQEGKKVAGDEAKDEKITTPEGAAGQDDSINSNPNSVNNEEYVELTLTIKEIPKYKLGITYYQENVSECVIKTIDDNSLLYDILKPDDVITKIDEQDINKTELDKHNKKHPNKNISIHEFAVITLDKIQSVTNIISSKKVTINYKRKIQNLITDKTVTIDSNDKHFGIKTKDFSNNDLKGVEIIKLDKSDLMYNNDFIEGDIITKIDGNNISNHGEATKKFNEIKGKKEKKITYIKKDELEPKTIRIEAITRIKAIPANIAKTMTTKDYCKLEERECRIIDHVSSDNDNNSNIFQKNDIITHVNKTDVTDGIHFKQLIQNSLDNNPDKDITFKYKRNFTIFEKNSIPIDKSLTLGITDLVYDKNIEGSIIKNVIERKSFFGINGFKENDIITKIILDDYNVELNKSNIVFDLAKKIRKRDFCDIEYIRNKKLAKDIVVVPGLNTNTKSEITAKVNSIIESNETHFNTELQKKIVKVINELTSKMKTTPQPEPEPESKPEPEPEKQLEAEPQPEDKPKKPESEPKPVQPEDKPKKPESEPKPESEEQQPEEPPRETPQPEPQLEPQLEPQPEDKPKKPESEEPQPKESEESVQSGGKAPDITALNIAKGTAKFIGSKAYNAGDAIYYRTIGYDDDITFSNEDMLNLKINLSYIITNFLLLFDNDDTKYNMLMQIKNHIERFINSSNILEYLLKEKNNIKNICYAFKIIASNIINDKFTKNVKQTDEQQTLQSRDSVKALKSIFSKETFLENKSKSLIVYYLNIIKESKSNEKLLQLLTRTPDQASLELKNYLTDKFYKDVLNITNPDQINRINNYDIGQILNNIFNKSTNHYSKELSEIDKLINKIDMKNYFISNFTSDIKKKFDNNFTFDLENDKFTLTSSFNLGKQTHNLMEKSEKQQKTIRSNSLKDQLLALHKGNDEEINKLFTKLNTTPS